MGRVVGFLAREALVERSGEGRIESVLRPELVRRWSQDYGPQKSNEASSYLAPRGISTVLDSLRTAAGYSITGSLAAMRRSSVTPARLATLYTEDPEALARKLGLSEVESEGAALFEGREALLPELAEVGVRGDELLDLVDRDQAPSTKPALERIAQRGEVGGVDAEHKLAMVSAPETEAWRRSCGASPLTLAAYLRKVSSAMSGEPGSPPA